MEKLNVLGIPIDKVDARSAMERFRELMARPGCDIIVTPNSEIVVSATKDEELKGIIERAGLVIPDGIGLVYASKILKQPLSGRVTGIDFLSFILMELAEKGEGVFLLGSKPETAEEKSIAERAAEAMKNKFPGLIISGTHDGYFKPEEEASIVAEINASGASFLVAAMGSPKQEKFIENHKDEFTAVRCAMGVGGSLDVWAGAVERAPEFYQKHGLEWAYRLIKEPVRIKRMGKLPVFMLRVLGGNK